MHAWHWRIGLGAAALWLVTAVYGTECSFMEYYTYPINYTGYIAPDSFVPVQILSQEDLNNRSAGCTTIIGDVWIASNYTGTLVLHNVTNITGSIETVTSSSNSQVAPQFNLTSIEMPDLVVVSGIFIASSQPLELLSFPKLTSSDNSLQFYTGYTPTNISFPALVNITDLSIIGNTSALNFDSLRNVSDVIQIKSNFDDQWIQAYWKSSPSRSISFPSLQHAGRLGFVGNISSVNVPMLETVRLQYHYDWDSVGFNIANSGKALEVTAPLLWNTTVVRLSGAIETFSFPSLIHLDGDFIVSTNSHVNVSVVPLQTASNVLLTGNITGYDVSSLKGLKYELQIHTNLETIDCTQAITVWANLTHDVIITKSTSPNYDELFICSGAATYPSTNTKPRKSLSTAAQTGIAIGVSLSIIILLFMLRRRLRHMKKERLKIIPPPAYNHELQETVRRENEDADGEVLPGYQPRGAPGVVAVEEGAIVGVEGIVPEPDPPAYDTHTSETVPGGSEEPEGRISDTTRPMLETRRAE